MTTELTIDIKALGTSAIEQDRPSRKSKKQKKFRENNSLKEASFSNAPGGKSRKKTLVSPINGTSVGEGQGLSQKTKSVPPSPQKLSITNKSCPVPFPFIEFFVSLPFVVRKRDQPLSPREERCRVHFCTSGLEGAKWVLIPEETSVLTSASFGTIQRGKFGDIVREVGETWSLPKFMREFCLYPDMFELDGEGWMGGGSFSVPEGEIRARFVQFGGESTFEKILLDLYLIPSGENKRLLSLGHEILDDNFFDLTPHFLLDIGRKRSFAHRVRTVLKMEQKGLLGERNSEVNRGKNG